MLLDSRQFPFVYLRRDIEPGEPVARQLETILARKKRYVLISNKSERLESTADSDKERVAALKAHREGLRRYCIAAIVIDEQAADDPNELAAGLAVGRAFELKFIVVKDDREARLVGEALLAQTP